MVFVLLSTWMWTLALDKSDFSSEAHRWSLPNGMQQSKAQVKVRVAKRRCRKERDTERYRSSLDTLFTYDR